MWTWQTHIEMVWIDILYICAYILFNVYTDVVKYITDNRQNPNSDTPNPKQRPSPTRHKNQSGYY